MAVQKLTVFLILAAITLCFAQDDPFEPSIFAISGDIDSHNDAKPITLHDLTEEQALFAVINFGPSISGADDEDTGPVPSPPPTEKPTVPPPPPTEKPTVPPPPPTEKPTVPPLPPTEKPTVPPPPPTEKPTVPESITTTPKTSKPKVREFEFVGCYANHHGTETALDDIPRSHPEMTVVDCYFFCTLRFANYFGIFDATKCYCGFTINTTQVVQDRCRLTCPGNPLEVCGGSSAISIYVLPKPKVVSRPEDPVGCYFASDSSTLGGPKLSSSDMTQSVCASECAKYLTKYFGLMTKDSQGSCHCGNEIPSGEQNKYDMSFCQYKCPGVRFNMEVCGSDMFMLVFKLNIQS
ncbi:hypothetical protein BOX15_Mlig001594g5 [Macrostomum lignano]|uniref:WSC domain-containing protein n=1 Tax=Macrostomum lignano TaxID=282301 RepID=A0A267F2X5_9PLAT|nr:hypothetical protein BOX15_Mlig001594g5 [Macrostomum lignano]